jgi:hypothetical protein
MLEKPPAAAAALVHVVPLEVKTLPGDPAATNETALVPAPIRTEPVVKVVAPVPPEATPNTVVNVVAPVTPSVLDSVVAPETASVPDVDIPAVPSKVNAMFYS